MGVEAALWWLPVFINTNLASIVTDVFLFTVFQISLKEWSPTKATIISNVVPPPLLAKFLFSYSMALRISRHAAFGAAPKPANSGAKVTIVGISIPSWQMKKCVYFTPCRFWAMHFASEFRKRRGKQTSSFKSALKLRITFTDLFDFFSCCRKTESVIAQTRTLRNSIWCGKHIHISENLYRKLLLCDWCTFLKISVYLWVWWFRSEGWQTSL